MKKIITRRSFLGKAAAASTLGPLILPRLSFADSPSSRLQHAAIGVGGQGAYDLGQINASTKVDVVALCDIDETNLAKAHERYPKARLYRDWREMLEEEENNLDSVNVSTPDHTHAPASMTAIRKGLHTFCEKPLTHDVYEARKLTLAARRYDVATQMGIQIHSHDAYRIAVIWLKEGAIGKVKEWHSWSDVSHTYPTGKRPETSEPVPDHVDWNLWLGSAPERPYKNEIYHPFEWRGWRDFGSGAAGDFACHIFDPVFTALGVTAPTSVRSEAGSNHEEVHPAWAKTESP